jgi:hypothetical protein
MFSPSGNIPILAQLCSKFNYFHIQYFSMEAAMPEYPLRSLITFHEYGIQIAQMSVQYKIANCQQFVDSRARGTHHTLSTTYRH